MLIGGKLYFSPLYHEQMLARYFGIPSELNTFLRFFFPRGAISTINNELVVEMSPELKPYWSSIAEHFHRTCSQGNRLVFSQAEELTASPLS